MGADRGRAHREYPGQAGTPLAHPGCGLARGARSAEWSVSAG
jgi:hypothetical protein